MDIDNFELDDAALEEAELRREQQLAEDEKPVVVDDEECEACNI